MTPVRINARDGYSLGATLFRADGPNGGAVVIHAAAGVRQEYYAKFAAYLAARGFTALTFDYRGIGSSCPPRLRGFHATMRDWAVLDAAGALDFLESEAAGARISVVGHSFGGQCLAIVPGNERYASVLAVASQSGYWRHWTGIGRAGMWLASHVVLPGISRLLGYFPARLLGQGEDLPAGMAIEWASWCRHPGYIVGMLGEEARYARFRTPLRLVWVADDSYAPRAAANALLGFYPGAPSEICEIHPSQLGVKQIGHFGFFRDRFRTTLWKDAADWLSRAGLERGFTLVEMVFVLGIIAVLSMMTLPLYIERNIQQQVKEGVAFAEFVQKNVSIAYALSGALPKDNAAAGLPAPEKIIGNYVTSATVAEGVITLVFGNLAVGNIKGRKVTLRPGYVPDAPQVPLSWVCGPGKVPSGLTLAGNNSTDIPQEWLPVACRP